MIHFLVLSLFAALVGIVFGNVSNEAGKSRIIYGLKVFGQFILAGLVIGWILYFIPPGNR